MTTVGSSDKRSNTDRLLNKLISLTDQVANGCYDVAGEIFELTKAGVYPEQIVKLAEAFGMMVVRLEVREYQLQERVENLIKKHQEVSQVTEKLSSENNYLKNKLRQKFAPKRIVGQSPQVLDLLETIDKIADTPVNVLILGETGTGKELFAKAIHYQSYRNDKPFVALNCSALPEHLVESELFGIEKGVATGVDRRAGKIEQADGGTLFLDEMGDMPLSVQAKLLRVLEEREFERVGGRKTIHVDIRVIAATSRNLKKALEQNTFREDLFYRLNVVRLNVPPVRERKDDIPLLLNAFLEYWSKNLNRGAMNFNSELLRLLKEYPWPGNVRELENEVERAVALAVSETIELDDLSEDILNYFRSRVEGKTDLTPETEVTEPRLIKSMLAATKGNKSEAARRLGLSREGLRKKMIRHGIS
ncbi:MAG: sigma-54-dependent Fis family transcriptional regulator [Deltaproteobacteria bacterium]|nr:sigma-54-dependent Fis family transcriptional regulator [Deltaproteobacteria bacterium]